MSAKTEAQYVALLSLAEVGLGSIVHSFHIPLGGHLLSLNQAMLLSRSVIEDPSVARLGAAQSVNRISTTGALIKSLSPAGKVLTPMLALTVQGFLFSMGILVVGTGILGLMVGSMLLALWAIFQPIILGFLVYGKSIFQAALWAWEKLATSLGIDPRFGFWIFGGLILLKLVLACVAVQLSRMQVGRTVSEALGRKGRFVFLKRMESLDPTNRGHPVLGALKDLCSPIFLFSFVLTSAFIWVSRTETHVEVLWAILRPLAIAFVVFYLLRAGSPPKLRRALYRLSPTLAELLTESQSEMKKTPRADGEPEAPQPPR